MYVRNLLHGLSKNINASGFFESGWVNAVVLLLDPVAAQGFTLSVSADRLCAMSALTLPKIDRRIALVVALLLSLAVQAQGVFACQLDESMSGAMEHCCCDGDAMDSMPSTQGGCCDFDVQLQLTGSDPEDQHDVLFLDIQPLLKLPPTAASFDFYPSAAPAAVVASRYVDHALAKSGRTTYLSTLRLRI